MVLEVAEGESAACSEAPTVPGRECRGRTASLGGGPRSCGELRVWRCSRGEHGTELYEKTIGEHWLMKTLTVEDGRNSRG